MNGKKCLNMNMTVFFSVSVILLPHTTYTSPHAVYNAFCVRCMKYRSMHCVLYAEKKINTKYSITENITLKVIVNFNCKRYNVFRLAIVLQFGLQLVLCLKLSQ